MIKAKFALFKMQQTGMLGHAWKLVEAAFSEAPEWLDAVDVGHPLYEFVVAIMNAIMAVKAHIY